MTLPDLPNGPLVHCFEYLAGNYRSIGGTCRRFEDLYSANVERYHRTFWSEAAFSVSCAELCLEENLALNRMDHQEVLEHLAFEAAAHGRVAVLAWTRDSGLDLTTATRNDQTLMDLAVIENQFQALEFLQGVGCQYTEHHCVLAIRSENLPMLRYLHEHGCPWDAQLFHMAADVGNLEIVKYLQEDGCDKNEQDALCLPWAEGTLTLSNTLLKTPDLI